MLFKTVIQKKIRSGEVTLAFRRWKRQSVKANGTHRTGHGLVAIGKVEKTAEQNVTDTDARRAGYDNRDTLIEALADLEGDLYRIELAHAGEDPRIELRESDQLTAEEFEDVHRGLLRLDKASRVGTWTTRVLSVIEENPNRRAGDLADMLDYEKQWFKLNVRKLKNLGLTISGKIGYTLSPRGAAMLKRINALPTDQS